MILWRISNHRDLTGLGGERANGRWHSAARGKRVVYLSEHPAVALIEALAALKGNPDLLPANYQLLRIRVDDAIVPEVQSLGEKWRDDLMMSRAAGDEWLSRGSSALLAIPSAPTPESMNFLFNPLHPDARNVTIDWSKWLEYDRRLFKARE